MAADKLAYVQSPFSSLALPDTGLILVPSCSPSSNLVCCQVSPAYHAAHQTCSIFRDRYSIAGYTAIMSVRPAKGPAVKMFCRVLDSRRSSYCRISPCLE